MKKTLAVSLLLLLPLFFSTFSNATMTVHPLELTITMDNEFVHGNTSKKITITNNNDYSVNFTWYLDHPLPESIRANKTNIPSLSWITLEPKYRIAQPGDSVFFYIRLNIPESYENLNQYWEVWPSFKQNKSQGMFNFEQAVRLYIDTPNETAINGHLDDNSNNEYYIIYYLLISATVITLLILGILLYHKKINKK
ncbi:hypothetical protein MBGDF03_00755 [Thermoplasmatales archaeon SCGC AB-540-F20]|nr:hypothetical protein MBGDF03_00755 [Thermoplasmatales archaeon SCGC AB-540-F20]